MFRFFSSPRTSAEVECVLRGAVTLYVIGGRVCVSAWEPATGFPIHSLTYTHTRGGESRSRSGRQTVGYSLRSHGSRGETKLSLTPRTTSSWKWSRRDVKREMLPFGVSRQRNKQRRRRLPKVCWGKKLWQQPETPSEGFVDRTWKHIGK